MDMVYVVSEITPLKGQAFPLSHMAKLNTQHHLGADCLCTSCVWSPRMTAHYTPGEWRLYQLLALPQKSIYFLLFNVLVLP